MPSTASSSCTWTEADIEALLGGPFGPLLIFGLRIVDVSLATTRMLLAMRNARLLVPVIGFFEVLVWIFAVGAAVQHLDSVWHVAGYAGGFATGNVVGLWLEERLALGLASIQIFSRHGGVELAEGLREEGFGATEFTGQGRDGPVEVVLTVVRRRHIRHVMAHVDRWDPDAFVSVEEPRAIRRGWMFPLRRK
jgi:uncharacterized protein YebE (UPF0316 family)